MGFLDQPITNPLEEYGYGGLCNEGSGPLNLLSNIFQLVVVAAGLFALINLIIAGIQYIGSQGKPEETQKAWAKIYMSFIGLIIVVGSFVIMAIISQMLFGDPMTVFQPKIYGPGECN